MAEATGAPARFNAPRRSLPYAGLLIGLWAAVVPYAGLGPDLKVESSREVVDHVVPGVLLLLVSAVMIVRERRSGRSGVASRAGAFPLVAGFGVLLAGLWMTATHLPLVTDARSGLVPDNVAAWHTVPGIVVMLLGLVWSAAYWSEAGEEAK